MTLSKIISDGKIAGKGDKGYYSGTQNETRYISLSTVNPVTAPKGKDLFDEWGEEDWNDVEDQKTAVMNDFFTNGLGHDSKMLTQATTQIRNTESTNEKKFQEAKTAQEAADSFLKDMIIAYISGGMAGIKASLKSKVEDQINSSLAAAFIRATGGSDDQIAMATQLVSFMRGKMQERKIKSNMAKNNLTNVAMGGLAIMTGGASLLLGSAMGAMGSFAASVGNVFGSASTVLGATFGSSIAGLTAGVTTAAYRAVAGDKAADALVNKISGPKDQLAAIKANENAIIKTAATGAIANATGLPKDVVGQLLTDYQGAQAAKKVRKAVNSNPIGNIGSQVVGAVGGIIKTAIVATGVPERDIQRALSDGNRIAFAGVTDAGMEAQSLAYMNQAMGMSAPGMKYTSNIPTLKNKEGLVEELGQRIVVDEIVKATGMDKDVADAAFRKQYGAIKQKKADKKAQSSAIRSTVVTAVTTAVTLGAAAAVTGPLASIGNALNSIGSAFGAVGGAATQVGAAVVKGAIQAIDGARNGIQGVLAGVANGAIGVLTAGVSPSVPMGTTFEPGAFLSTAASALQKTGVGLGISYDRQAVWGGAVGIGNGSANASITFSQHGGSQINVGVQGATINYNTANGTYGAGYTYNAGNGFSVGAAWNSATGASATAGYNQNGHGISITVDQSGVSSSASAGGITLGTNGPDGFHAAEINWVEQNLDQARNNNDVEMARRVKVGEDKYLAEKYKLSPEEIDKLSPDARDALIKAAAVVSGPQGNEAWGTSRLSGLDQFVGGFTDGIANVANFYNGDAASSDAVYVSPDGTVHPRTCFTAGTLIHTKDGLKAIEEIKISDVVLSKSDETGEVSYRNVLNTFVRQTDAIYKLSFNDGTILETTWNHRFRVLKPEANAQDFRLENTVWTEAKDLVSGDTTLSSNGSTLNIVSISIENREETVYNFEVEEYHTYFVGEKGIWVHNESYINNPSVANVTKRLLGWEVSDNDISQAYPGVDTVERFRLGQKYGAQFLLDSPDFSQSVERVVNGDLTADDLKKIDKLANEYADRLGLKGEDRKAFYAGLWDTGIMSQRGIELATFSDRLNSIAIDAGLTAAPFLLSARPAVVLAENSFVTKFKKIFGSTPKPASTSTTAATTTAEVGQAVVAGETAVINAATIAPRALTQSDIGINGVVRGTFSMQNKLAKVNIEMIDDNIANPFKIIDNLTSVAKAQGATSLNIEGVLANPRLYDILIKRYNFITEGGKEILRIPIK
ncbi:hypothetical protein LPTSP3_g13940 [Leptospira kobayashii]|uniref:Intein C-terminal splicing domain protein n=1 Tax=Leptospira kobayashii TaxID=1917830 RepID=A0ABN6KFC1_9LEPT|nr:hypothetical protein LPTSP3_g13940 [Leptospira kobayashii]